MTRTRLLAGRLGTALTAHLRRSESGITLAIFAVAVVVLLGFVAVGIDGSRMYDERRSAQNAADHAAMAAAWAECNSGVPLTAAQSSVQSNGYVNANLTLTNPAPGAYKAEIDAEIDATFGRLIGFTTLDVTADATAECSAQSGGGPGAVYAGGTCPSNKFGVDISGSSQNVYGGIHTNARANISGSNNDFTDATPPPDFFTHVGALVQGGSNNQFQAPYPSQVPMPNPVWPAGWAPSDVTGSGSPPAAGTFLRPYYDLADANGPTNATDTLFTSKVTALTKNGVYYTTSTDGFDIGSVSPTVTNVVLVAPAGPIKISASNLTLSPFNHASLPRENILMLSNMQKPSASENEKKCDEFTIAVSGSTSTWNGIMWATGGLIEMSGSSNTTANGTLIGWAVRLNGSNLTVNYNSGFFQGDPYVVILR